MNRAPTTAAEAWRLTSYFDVADELDGGLTLGDLEARFVAEARDAAITFGFPWPPHLASAEEYMNDHGRTVSTLLDDNRPGGKAKKR